MNGTLRRPGSARSGGSSGIFGSTGRLFAAVALVVTLLLSGCGLATVTGVRAAESSTGNAVDLDFTAKTVAGESFEGRTLAGKPTVLWFWAPWCPTCRAQISGVGALAAKHGDRVNVVGVGSQDDAEAIASFAANVPAEVVLLSDESGAVWRHFRVTAQSTYLVVDADGKELASGYLDDDKLAELVDSMVG